MHNDIHLTMASWDYDHIRDIATGLVKPKGIEITHLQMEVEEIFYRFAKSFEWDVSELSFAKYCSILSQDDPPITGIPVFVSRVFRHSAFYIRSDGSVKVSSDLKGKRIGIPEWSQTATVYARGWLHHQGGAKLDEVEWVQAGVNKPGRVEMANLNLPAGVSYTQVPDKSLVEMLLSGEIDAMVSAHPPHEFEIGNPAIARLFPNYREVEEAYFDETGIYPIMHTIAIKRDVYEEYPWVARNLMTAFEEARDRSVARLREVTASQIPVPWGYENAERTGKKIFGDYGLWPYGIEASRTTIEAFLQYCDEQGVTHRKLTPEDLYAPEAMTEFVI
jgi:4,5-dihydroxyphthalate decarboxylase